VLLSFPFNPQSEIRNPQSAYASPLLFTPPRGSCNATPKS
jgi:hypothetical protein